MDLHQKESILRFQKNEVTEYHIYRRLADFQKNSHNGEVLTELAEEEWKHYQLLKKYTGQTPLPDRFRIGLYVLLAHCLGLTFSIRLMERGEQLAQEAYRQYKDDPDLQRIALDEEEHEMRLIRLIDGKGLNYIGAVVLGLNDALVEFTGALAGYAFALQHAKLVALTGAITGIAAALSMAASEYLAIRAENDVHKSAVKAAIYTGITYIITVAVLILPFVLLSNVYWGLGICLFGALSIIALFNYYYSVVKSESFRKRFTEMVTISIGIATISFLIGYALRIFTGIKL